MERQYKIAIDARLYGLENAGLGRYIKNLIENLSKIDYKNNYFVLLKNKYYDSLKLPNNWIKVLCKSDHYSTYEQIEIPRILNKIKPDITHFPHFNVPLAYNRRFVVTIHDLLMHKQKGKEATTLPYGLYLMKRTGYKTIFYHAVKSAVKIITPSNTVKKELSEYYNIENDKIVTTYEGVDKNIVHENKRTINIPDEFKIKSDYLIYFGNAYPHKNINRVINSIIKLNKEGINIKFVIVIAKNYFAKKISTYLKKTNCKDVILFNYLTDEQLSYLLKHSKGYIFPSLSEGFGLPGLEAMANKTLLLASNIGVFKEIYGNNALYFDPLSEDEILNTLKKGLVMRKKEKDILIANAFNHSQTFSWEKMAYKTLSIYLSSLVGL